MAKRRRCAISTTHRSQDRLAQPQAQPDGRINRVVPTSAHIPAGLLFKFYHLKKLNIYGNLQLLFLGTCKTVVPHLTLFLVQKLLGRVLKGENSGVTRFTKPAVHAWTVRSTFCGVSREIFFFDFEGHER